MKRFLAMSALLVLTTAGALAEPLPLLTGAVRDQSGEPVRGARVEGVRADGSGEGSTRTDARGTFALEGEGIVRVRISCDYCRTEELPVVAGAPVVALVRRYSALLSNGPGPADLASIPYAEAEGALALEPFVALRDSSKLLPGPQVAFGGLSGSGLILQRGVPDYDLAANASSFRTTPDRYVVSLDAQGPGVAFLYGDRAGAGSFSLDPLPLPGLPELFAGTSSGGRVPATAGAASAIAGLSADPMQIARRVDFTADAAPGADTRLDAVASFSDGDLQAETTNHLESSDVFGRVFLERLRAQLTYAGITADQGTYAGADYGANVWSRWSGLEAKAGISGLPPASLFGEIDVRKNTGAYQSDIAPAIAASYETLRATLGERYASGGLSVLAGASAYDVGYQSGLLDPDYSSSSSGGTTSLLAPSFDAGVSLGARWKAGLTAAETFSLPSLLERYGVPPPSAAVVLNHNAVTQISLDYGDLARVRLEATYVEERTAGFDNGTTQGAGTLLYWQIAPTLSLRSWYMNATGTTAPSGPTLQYAPPFVPGTLGSAWLTYQANDAFRADAILERDLLNDGPYEHLDGAVSFHLAGKFRGMISTEQRHGTHATMFGITLQP